MFKAATLLFKEELTRYLLLPCHRLLPSQTNWRRPSGGSATGV
jgi:hypothetical protein